MNCHFDKNLFFASLYRRGFSLPETMAALVILAMVSSGVFVVINRCMDSANQLTLRTAAFETAHENMEKLLTVDVITERVEYGTSEKYPEIKWRTVVEPFYEPVTSKMWMGAVCSAEYPDANGLPQTIELVHWLTDLSERQIEQLTAEMEKEKELLAEQIIETIEEAAEYVGVDEETIGEWVESGMKMTADGKYLKDWLNLYADTDGNPTEEEIAEQIDIDQLFDNSDQPGPESGPDTPPPPNVLE